MGEEIRPARFGRRVLGRASMRPRPGGRGNPNIAHVGVGGYLRKGRPLFVEGRLRLDQWQDQQGNNRSKLKVVIDSFQFVDSQQDIGAASTSSSESTMEGPYRPEDEPPF